MEFREAEEARICGAEYWSGMSYTEKNALCEASFRAPESLGENHNVPAKDQLSKVRETTIRGLVRLTISRPHTVPTSQVERTHRMYKAFRKELGKVMH